MKPGLAHLIVNQGMPSHICGIPCIISNITIFGRCHPAKTNADPNSCHEAEFPEIEFSVFDRKGYCAPWLEAKLIQADRESIEEQILMRGQM